MEGVGPVSPVQGPGRAAPVQTTELTEAARGGGAAPTVEHVGPAPGSEQEGTGRHRLLQQISAREALLAKSNAELGPLLQAVDQKLTSYCKCHDLPRSDYPANLQGQAGLGAVLEMLDAWHASQTLQAPSARKPKDDVMRAIAGDVKKVMYSMIRNESQLRPFSDLPLELNAVIALYLAKKSEIRQVVGLAAAPYIFERADVKSESTLAKLGSLSTLRSNERGTLLLDVLRDMSANEDHHERIVLKAAHSLCFLPPGVSANDAIFKEVLRQSAAFDDKNRLLVLLSVAQELGRCNDRKAIAGEVLKQEITSGPNERYSSLHVLRALQANAVLLDRETPSGRIILLDVAKRIRLREGSGAG
jgi:hypothetical protein